jgi:hypothetical protein
VSNWWRADGHRLVLRDLDHVLEELPERLVVETAAYRQMRPTPTRSMSAGGAAPTSRSCRPRRRFAAAGDSTRDARRLRCV